MDLHNHWTLIFPLIGQAGLFFFALVFVQHYPRLTVSPWFLGKYEGIGHRVCRGLAALAYLTATIQALASLSAILAEVSGAMTTQEASKWNEGAIYAARWAGLVLGFHLVGLIWMTAQRLQACPQVKGGTEVEG